MRFQCPKCFSYTLNVNGGIIHCDSCGVKWFEEKWIKEVDEFMRFGPDIRT